MAHAQNYKTCMAQATQALERILCEVQKLDRNSSLPNIEEFKKNPANMQALLLKRDAERFGIDIPELSKHEADPATKQRPEPGPETETASESARKVKTAVERPSLAGCSLHGDYVRCAKDRYELVGNLKNNQLKAEAFSSHNELIFTAKQDGEFRDQSDYRYLSSIYPNYIYKMLEIGLGASTMSFTKFATIYWQSKKDESGFSERFRRVYNQLKIEKSRNLVQSRYSKALPENIDTCMRMDRFIIICDNKIQNWVYKLR